MPKLRNRTEKADSEMYLLDRPVSLFRGLFHQYDDHEMRNDLQACNELNDRSLINASSATESTAVRSGYHDTTKATIFRI